LEQFSFAADWVGDIDGDGLEDFLAGSPFFDVNDPVRRGRVSLISSSNGASIWTKDADQLSGTQILGWELSRMRDVSGDGIPDFAILVQAGNGLAAQYVSVFDGSSFLELWRVEPLSHSSNYGIRGVAGGTDISGDGVPDLVVVDDTFSGSILLQGIVYAYSGVDGSLLWEATGGIQGQRLGGSLACPGDLNGDGYADVLVDSDLGGANGAVHVLSGLDGSEMYMLIGGYSGAFMGVDMSWIGDWDQDGLNDFIVNSAEPTSGINNGFGIVYRGYDGAELVRWEGPHPGHSFGLRVGGPGDVDGDGFVDAAVSAPDFLGDQDSVYLYSGRTGEMLTRLTGSLSPTNFGDPVLSQGADLNGDGRVEVAIADFAAWSPGLPGAGALYTFSFDPYLSSTIPEISAAAGGSVDFDLAFPASEANRSYQFLASRDQPGGAITVGGVGIPLVDSPILRRMITAPPPAFQYSTGTLDTNAQATVTLTLPPGAATPYLGKTLKFAAVSLAGLAPSLSSAPVYLEIAP